MNNDNQNEGKFLSGFLLGLLVGGFVVFLLGTKKGKKLLKAISEDGVDNIFNILDEANRPEDFQDEELDEIVEKPSFVKAPVGRREFAVKDRSIQEKPKARRFFRGISRRVN